MIQVYLLRNEVTGKQYVGQTRQTLHKRWRCHVDKALSKTTKKWRGLLHHDIKELGQKAFTIKLLQECSTQEEADIVEQRYIDSLQTKSPNGYNIRDGGTHGKHAPETILLYKRKVYSAETRAKLAAAQRGHKSNSRQLAGLRIGWEMPHEPRPGELNPNVRLTEAQVLEIRRLCAEGKLSQFKIADQFGIQQVTVSAIKRRVIWKHLP